MVQNYIYSKPNELFVNLKKTVIKAGKQIILFIYISRTLI